MDGAAGSDGEGGAAGMDTDGVGWAVRMVWPDGARDAHGPHPPGRRPGPARGWRAEAGRGAGVRHEVRRLRAPPSQPSNPRIANSRLHAAWRSYTKVTLDHW